MKQTEKRKSQIQADRILGIAFIFCFICLIFANVIGKDKEISEQENRSLTQKPKLTVESLTSGRFMEQYESYVSDQFVGRDFWRKLNTKIAKFGGSREENGVFLGKSHQLMEKIEKPGTSYDENIKKINSFAKKHKKVKTSMLLVPDAAQILDDSMPLFATTTNQKQLFEKTKKDLSKKVKWIDGSLGLEQHKDEKIYYKTDHHWTSYGAYVTFLSAAKSLGISKKDIPKYEIYPVTTEFNGTLSSTSGFELDETEQIEVYLEKGKQVSTIVNYVNDKNKRTALYDTSKLKTKDKYGVFLGGNSSLIDIKTTSKKDRTLLLIKDSFANSFIPFLAPHFKEIVVVDPRYYYETTDEIFDMYKITDTLFMYSGNTFYGDNNIGGVL